MPSFLSLPLAHLPHPPPPLLPLPLPLPPIIPLLILTINIHPKPPHSSRIAPLPLIIIIVEPHPPQPPPQRPRRDASEQAADAGAGAVDFGVLGAAGGGEGPVDVGGGDVVNVFGLVLGVGVGTGFRGCCGVLKEGGQTARREMLFLFGAHVGEDLGAEVREGADGLEGLAAVRVDGYGGPGGVCGTLVAAPLLGWSSSAGCWLVELERGGASGGRG